MYEKIRQNKGEIGAMRLNRRGPKNDMHCRKMNSIESTTSTTDEIQHEQGRRKSRLGSLLFMEDFEVD